MFSETSAVTQDYLKAIYAATEWGGDGISVSGLAAHMGVVVSTASENVRKLSEQGLVDHVPYRGVRLTPTGKSIAIATVRRHRLLETYLHAALGFDWDEVHEEAEILEHAISDRLLERIDKRLGYPVRDPHGDPIPSADGQVDEVAARPLAEVALGESATVLRISDADPQLLRHLEQRGIVIGARITVQERLEFAGTWQVQVTGETAELAAPGMAAVWVSI